MSATVNHVKMEEAATIRLVDTLVVVQQDGLETTVTKVRDVKRRSL